MSYSGNYNAVDRALHRFAFASPLVQKVLGEIENDLFKKDLKSVDSRNEVFITGLPRAGTTLMLELLYATGEFQSFRYRDMPFILAPLLWNRLSRSFRKNGNKQERAHGDGMEISVESPEAFDEVIWLTYMAKNIISEDNLTPVTAKDIDREFCEAIQNSVCKILALSSQDEPNRPQPRYLSKNNANISRIDALLRIFPTSNILVIFRHPLAHISSLATQHKRFLEEHSNDSFSKKYMEWIGHFEFGENFKPINFDGWLNDTDQPFCIDETFWLRYWNAAYTYALEHKTSRVHFIDFDKLLEHGESSLKRIAMSLDLNHESTLAEGGKKLRRPTTSPVRPNKCSPDVWKHAEDIYARLGSIAI